MLCVINVNDLFNTGHVVTVLKAGAVNYILDTDDLLVEQASTEDLRKAIQDGVDFINLVQLKDGRLEVTALHPFTYRTIIWCINGDLTVREDTSVAMRKSSIEFRYNRTSESLSIVGSRSTFKSGMNVLVGKDILCSYSVTNAPSNLVISYVYRFKQYFVVKVVSILPMWATFPLIVTTVVLNNTCDVVGVVPDKHFESAHVIKSLDVQFIAKLGTIGGRKY